MATAKTPSKAVKKKSALPTGKKAGAATRVTVPAIEPPESGVELFSDLSKFWDAVREEVEGFATTYFSPSKSPKSMTAQEWMQNSTDFLVQLSFLWARGVTLVAQEGGRMISSASGDLVEKLAQEGGRAAKAAVGQAAATLKQSARGAAPPVTK
jgi:hypothetical protein